MDAKIILKGVFLLDIVTIVDIVHNRERNALLSIFC